MMITQADEGPMAEPLRPGINDRQQEIINLVRERGYVSIDMLA